MESHSPTLDYQVPAPEAAGEPSPIGTGPAFFAVLATALSAWSQTMPAVRVGPFLAALALWPIAGLGWLFWVLVPLLRREFKPTTRKRWVIWLLPPALGALTALLLVGEVPRRAIFLAHRPALDGWAQRAASMPAPPPPKIGIYDASPVMLLNNGMQFFVQGGFFRYGGGFAYTTDGRPPVQADRRHQYWHAGGNWWFMVFDGG